MVSGDGGAGQGVGDGDLLPRCSFVETLRALAGQSCKLLRGPIVQAAVRPLEIVLFPPGRDLFSSIPQVPEPAHVQELVAQPPLKALGLGVLRRLAGLDVQQLLDLCRERLPLDH